MAIRTASVVELGSPDLATVTGYHPELAVALEEMIVDRTQIYHGRFRFTLMHDNRICIEKDFLPVATEEEEVFATLMEKWGTAPPVATEEPALEEVFTDHFEQGEKAQ